MSITAEEFDGFEGEYDEGGLSGFYVLAIFLALMAAFLVIVYFAYERGKASATLADADLPVVAADPRPVREEVPLAMGGSERREVYDRIEGVTPTAVIADARPGRDPMEGFDAAPAALPPADAPAARSEPRAAEPVVAASQPARTPATRPAAEPAPAAKPAAPVVVAEATPAPAAPAPARAEAAAPGTHVVQVGAFGSNAEAMRFYETLSGKLGTYVSEQRPDVQVAEVKGTTYHRLRLAPFASYGAANEYCAGLKAKGQDCLVKGV